MKSYLGFESDALHRAAGEVLHYIWDPIGVAGVVNARDEYDGYIESTCALIWSGTSEADIAMHLEKIATEHMGLAGAIERSKLAARKLVEWHRAVTR